MSAQHVVKPYILAANGSKLQMKFELKDMIRLKTMLSSNLGSVSAEFTFFTDKYGSKIKLKSRAKLKVLCQRCSAEIEIKVPVASEVLLVKTDAELEKLSDETDAITAGDELSLAELLEDELILAMPMLPKHDLVECQARQYIKDAKAEDTHRPFAKLENIWSN